MILKIADAGDAGDDASQLGQVCHTRRIVVAPEASARAEARHGRVHLATDQSTAKARAALDRRFAWAAVDAGKRASDSVVLEDGTVGVGAQSNRDRIEVERKLELIQDALNAFAFFGCRRLIQNAEQANRQIVAGDRGLLLVHESVWLRFRGRVARSISRSG